MKKVGSTCCDREHAIRFARKMIRSLDETVELVRTNAEINCNEIGYAHNRKVISGSKFDPLFTRLGKIVLP